MWRAAITAGADRVTITSYNEWHEGTQIEPAALSHRRGRYRYVSYDGAWGLHGELATYAYIDRTLYWVDAWAKMSAQQPSISASKIHVSLVAISPYGWAAVPGRVSSRKH